MGYHPKLARIKSAARQDIDVLFYGSLNERRRKVLAGIEAAGLKLKVLRGVYGEGRDAWIARSKVVLNVHHYPTQIFEVVRVFYLMTNSKAVVAEVGEGTSIEDGFRSGIVPATFADLAETAAAVAADTSVRARAEVSAFSAIARHPQADYLARLLK